MNIDEMPAGRELDALVAEKVMGYVWAVGPECANQHCFLISPEEFKWRSREKGKDRDGDEAHPSTLNWKVVQTEKYKYKVHDEVPEHSTDIAAAWLVVEKIKNFKLKSVDYFNIVWDGEEWFVEWCEEVPYEPCYDQVVGRGHTAPLAICRAALSSVGV